MASAAPQQQPPLPVPAPAAALFASLYGDASNDPTGSREGILLNPFLHHLTDNTLNTDTNEIRNRVAQSGSQHQFIALSVVHGGRARLYIAPHRWEDGLTANNPSLNNRFFAFEGELINNTVGILLNWIWEYSISSITNRPSPQLMLSLLPSLRTLPFK